MADEHPQPRRRLMVHGLTPARKPLGSAHVAQPSAPPSGAPPFLIGHGYDIHRLQKDVAGGQLVLAGVTVSEDLSPIAHSDGDVILHAIVDAMLGAIGMGDIGQLFSETDPRWKGAASGGFVQEVLPRVRRAGYRVGNVDVTLMLERPRVAPFRQQMLANIRQLLEPVSVVNLKAGTNEACDAVGRGEAVAAHAVVLLISEARGG